MTNLIAFILSSEADGDWHPPRVPRLHREREPSGRAGSQQIADPLEKSLFGMTEDSLPSRSCITSGTPANPILDRSHELPITGFQEGMNRRCDFNILVLKHPDPNELAESVSTHYRGKYFSRGRLNPCRQYRQSPQDLVFALVQRGVQPLPLLSHVCGWKC